MKHISSIVVAVLVFTLTCLVKPGATEPVTIVQAMTGKWYQVERSNWSQYRNGKYIGLTHRETRTTVTASPVPDGTTRFTGFCYVLEETMRDLQKSARSLDEAVMISFATTADGHMRITGVDNGYPRLRNFPLLPAVPVRPGDRWEGESMRIVDPLNSGLTTAMPIQVGYEYTGEEVYKGIPVYRIKAKYATRINKYLRNRSDDPALQEATGTHDVDILISRETGAVILMLDRLDETFMYADGSSVRFRGSTAVFGEIPAPVDRKAIVTAVQPYGITRIAQAEPRKPADNTSRPDAAAQQENGQKAKKAKSDASVSGKPDDKRPATKPDTSGEQKTVPFVLEETDQGVRLSLRDIRFIADSAEILPEEAWRLDAIAETLGTIPGGRFLVEGHTADVGNPSGEKKLSVERAERVIHELEKRGIGADQFIFAGYGGTRPVADNRTAEGRAQNRRVEITILE